MAEAEKPKNGMSCDTSNDSNNVINHGGIVTKSTVDNHTSMSKAEGSPEASEVVNKEKTNACEKSEEGNSKLSGLTKSSGPIEIPPLISLKQEEETTKRPRDTILTDNLKSEATPSKQTNSSSTLKDSKLQDGLEQINQESAKNNHESFSNKLPQPSTDSDEKSVEFDNKLHSPGACKTPPPIPRRQSEKVNVYCS